MWKASDVGLPGTPDDVAFANLETVVAALGAYAQFQDGYVSLKIKDCVFQVGPAIVRRIDSDGRIEVSCILPREESPPPSAERIASALIWLKNQPEIFDVWEAEAAEVRRSFYLVVSANGGGDGDGYAR